MRTLTELTSEHHANLKGGAYMTWAICKALTRDTSSALLLFEQRVGPRHPYVADFQKAAIAPISSAGEPGILSPYQDAFAERFVGKAAVDTLPFLRVPLNMRVGVQPSGGTPASWVAEFANIPVARFEAEPSTLSPDKIAQITVFTSEVARDPKAAGVIERQVVRNLAEGSDNVFLNPLLGGSLSNGAATIPSTGDLAVDLPALLAELSQGVPGRPALILGAAAAQQAAFTGPIYSTVKVSGAGEVAGIPTFASSAVTLSHYIVALDLAAIIVASSPIELDKADQTTLELDDAPSGAGPRTSLWQTNMIAIKGQRLLAWTKAADAVAYLDLS